MKYTVTADTDTGISKHTNEDSVIVKHAVYDGKEIVMAAICDGMGGLAKGELASATVIRTFQTWFDQKLPYEIKTISMPKVAEVWSQMLKELNRKMGRFGEKAHISLGTTCTAVFFYGDEYAVTHIGDTRFYVLGSKARQLTTDQTYIAREISRGTMTPAEAKTDKRRNMLLQCVGASSKILPEVLTGIVEPGAYLLCSDGFRHQISEKEIYDSLNPINLFNKDAMHSNIRYLMETVKERQERDNISAVLIKTEQEE